MDQERRLPPPESQAAMGNDPAPQQSESVVSQYRRMSLKDSDIAVEPEREETGCEQMSGTQSDSETAVRNSHIEDVTGVVDNDAQAAMQTESSGGPSLRAQGDEAVDSGDFCAAIRLYTHALVDDEDSIELLYQRAVVKRR